MTCAPAAAGRSIRNATGRAAKVGGNTFLNKKYSFYAKECPLCIETNDER
jgi:hypothetical protein